MVRDYTKWDDNPVSLSHFAESSVRAYKIAMTPPYEPVVIVADAVLQEEPMPEADRRTARFRSLRCRRRRRAIRARWLRLRKLLGGGGKSGDRRGTLGAHSAGDRSAGGACRNVAGAGAGSPFPHELSVAASL